MAAVFIPPASASADSATITAVDAGGGQMHVTADVTSTTCSGTFCSWFSFAYERHSSLPCLEDEAFLMGVHSGLETTGTVHEEWNYEPFFPRQDKICVFISDGLGAHPVGEAIISLPSGYGRQRTSGHNCSYFSSQRRAEYYLELYPSDPSGLDGDHDGSACESNRCPCGAEAIPAEPEPPPPAPVVITPPPPPPPPSAECILAREKSTYWKRQVSNDNLEIRYSYRPKERRRWTHRRNVAEGALKRAKTWVLATCV